VAEHDLELLEEYYTKNLGVEMDGKFKWKRIKIGKKWKNEIWEDRMKFKVLFLILFILIILYWYLLDRAPFRTVVLEKGAMFVVLPETAIMIIHFVNHKNAYISSLYRTPMLVISSDQQYAL
jgi:Mn2+/Fe2+ NRAMP family transporter